MSGPIWGLWIGFYFLFFYFCLFLIILIILFFFWGKEGKKCMDKILEIIYIYLGERDILEITSKLYMILSICT